MASDIAEEGQTSLGGPGAKESPTGSEGPHGASQLQPSFFDDDRPQYHVQPPAGWMNDPNGPIYYKGTPRFGAGRAGTMVAASVSVGTLPPLSHCIPALQ